MKAVSGSARSEKNKENQGFLLLSIPQQGGLGFFDFCINTHFGRLLDAKKTDENQCFFNIFPPRTRARSRWRLFREVPEAKKPRKTNVFSTFSLPGRRRGRDGGCFGGCPRQKKQGKQTFLGFFFCCQGKPTRKTQGKPRQTKKNKNSIYVF